MNARIPRLTCIIPVYNGMPFLVEAVRSVLSQSWTDFDLLIADDGSTDGSCEYVRTIRDPRVRLIAGAHKGLCANFNRALSESADTPYIARLDQDDRALAGRFKTQVEFLDKHSEFGAAFCGIRRIGKSGLIFASKQQPLTGHQVYSYDQHGMIVHSAMLARRDLLIKLGGYRQAFYPADDLDLTLRMTQTAQIAVLNQPLIDYRVHGGSGSFKAFDLMQAKTRYIENMRLRGLLGGKEENWEAWYRHYRATTLMPVRRIRDFGKYAFRASGSCAGEQRWLRGALWFAAAAVCRPEYSFSRLRMMLGQPGPLDKIR